MIIVSENISRFKTMKSAGLGLGLIDFEVTLTCTVVLLEAAHMHTWSHLSASSWSILVLSVESL